MQCYLISKLPFVLKTPIFNAVITDIHGQTWILSDPQWRPLICTSGFICKSAENNRTGNHFPPTAIPYEQASLQVLLVIRTRNPESTEYWMLPRQGHDRIPDSNAQCDVHCLWDYGLPRNVIILEGRQCVCHPAIMTASFIRLKEG